MVNKVLMSGLLCTLISFNSSAATVLDELPESVLATDKFVFYAHGYIVEGDNPKPVNTKQGWGIYDFPAIKQALSDDSYTLIAHHRAKNTDPFDYAYKLNQQVRTLVAKGVEPKNIALVGFSRGAFITGLTSDKLSDLAINTVILAGCGRLAWKKHTDVKVYGHVLSVYEKSDDSKSCSKLDEKSRQTRSFTEIQINTGLSHGAFYRPIKEWVDPVKQWIKTRFK